MDGETRELREKIDLDKKRKHTIEVVVDRLVLKPGLRKRLTDSVETTLRLSSGIVIIPGESIDDYRQFWDDMEVDWQPADKTEYCFFEDMIVARWMLARVDWSENRIAQTVNFGPRQLDYCVVLDRRRTKFERSFERSMENLKKAQAARKARPEPKPEPKPEESKPAPQPVKPQQPAPPPPEYVMSDPGSEQQPLTCAPETDDSRS